MLISYFKGCIIFLDSFLIFVKFGFESVLGVGVFRLWVLVWLWSWVRGWFLNPAQLLEYFRVFFNVQINAKSMKNCTHTNLTKNTNTDDKGQKSFLSISLIFCVIRKLIRVAMTIQASSLLDLINIAIQNQIGLF